MVSCFASVVPTAINWLSGQGMLLWLMGGGSLVCFFGSLWLVPFLINRMEPDHFSRLQAIERGELAKPPRKLLATLFLNLLGFLILLAGIAMLFVPGQGLLTIFIGICLMNFPGKQGLILFLVKKPKILSALNWIRGKGGRIPFTFKE